MRIQTFKCETQRLKIQTMIEISKKVLNPSVTLFQRGTHGESAGSVFMKVP